MIFTHFWRDVYFPDLLQPREVPWLAHDSPHARYLRKQAPGFMALARAVALSSLEALDVSACGLGPADALALADVLPESRLRSARDPKQGPGTRA